MALLIPDEKCLVLQHKTCPQVAKNAAGYHLGPVAPSAADPAQLEGSRIFFQVRELLGSMERRFRRIPEVLQFGS